MNLTSYLTISALLFAIGAYGVLTRRNAIAVLMGIELMLNAANLNFLAFWRYLAPKSMEPQVFVLVGITVAAAEAAVGLAVILNVYRRHGTINVEEISNLKG
jgi:NADH:ubiquinone oxidoreductase subunit K